MICLRGFPFALRRGKIPVWFFSLLVVLVSAPFALAQERWTGIGPDGGDARAFASAPDHPEHLYLGTTNSWLYESLDEGASWRRLARFDRADGLVLDSIVVDATDPATIYVGAWKNSDDGGLWISHDGGKSWTESPAFKGQAIHALAQAASDPHLLFAGTLEGVYRSADSGATWTEISPRGSREIHEVESLAVDPKNSEIIYAGTWHLPWKTVDGGKNWRNIKQGIIDDSDVFSIIVDPVRTHIVYLSACSGIYKSENAGLLFHKIQGIPSSARRTRVLMQDPKNREIVYAGTTEGLYKTVNGGKNFRLMTDDDVVVNGVYVDPANSNHVLLATDRGGVRISDDGGASFTASNHGISERKIAALLVGRNDPRQIYAGVVNDKNYGGVFHSSDGGAHWEQLVAGLDGRDVFSLAESSDGIIVAGTSHGIFALGTEADDSPVWRPRNAIANTVLKMATEKLMGTRVNIEKQVQVPTIELESLVNAVDASGPVWAAATNYGLLTSRDRGTTWQGGPVAGKGNFLSVAVLGDQMAAAQADGVAVSHDAGKSWWPMGVPTMLTRIHRVAFSPDGTLWLGAREGVYYTRDLGKSWMWIHRLPFRDIDDLSYDPQSRRMLVSSRSSDQVYAIDSKNMTWEFWRAGYKIALIRSAGDHLVAASLNDGVVVGPKLPPPAPDESTSPKP